MVSAGGRDVRDVSGGRDVRDVSGGEMNEVVIHTVLVNGRDVVSGSC